MVFNAHTDCLHHVLFPRYTPLSLEVVEKRTNVAYKNLLAPSFFGRVTLIIFYNRLLPLFTFYRLAKFG